MLPALNSKELRRKSNERYDDGQCVVGIMLARYDLSITKQIVSECYNYWHLNSGKYLDIFWAGYGEYLSYEEQNDTKTILNFIGNSNRAYFDLEAFISIKNKFNSKLKKPFEDKLQLVLLNYRNGKLYFDESFQINLEKNIDENFSSIREVFEWITNESKCSSDVQTMVKNLKQKKFFDKIKGVSISDVINTSIGVLGIF